MMPRFIVLRAREVKEVPGLMHVVFECRPKYAHLLGFQQVRKVGERTFTGFMGYDELLDLMVCGGVISPTIGRSSGILCSRCRITYLVDHYANCVLCGTKLRTRNRYRREKSLRYIDIPPDGE